MELSRTPEPRGMSIIDLCTIVAGVAVSIPMVRGRLGPSNLAYSVGRGVPSFHFTSIHMSCFLPLLAVATALAPVILARVVQRRRSIHFAEWPAVLLAVKLVSWYEINQFYDEIWDFQAGVGFRLIRPSGWVFFGGLSLIAVMIVAGLQAGRDRINTGARAIWLVVAMAAIVAGPVYLASNSIHWISGPANAPWRWATLSLYSAYWAILDVPMLILLLVPTAAALGQSAEKRRRWPWTAWAGLLIAGVWMLSWWLNRASVFDIANPLRWADIAIRGLMLAAIFAIARWVATKMADPQPATS